MVIRKKGKKSPARLKTGMLILPTGGIKLDRGQRYPVDKLSDN